MTALLLILALAAHPACWADGHNAHRSRPALRAFRHAHPCPGGVDRGSVTRCRGYIIDHVVSLACCGPDAPCNMQWQTKDAAKAKDRWENDCAAAARRVHNTCETP